MTLSKTAAIRKARTHIGPIMRRSGTEYVFFGPHLDTDPSGPSAEVKASSYPMALAHRARCVARLALTFMGRADCAPHLYRADGSAEAMVTYALETDAHNRA